MTVNAAIGPPNQGSQTRGSQTRGTPTKGILEPGKTVQRKPRQHFILCFARDPPPNPAACPNPKHQRSQNTPSLITLDTRARPTKRIRRAWKQTSRKNNRVHRRLGGHSGGPSTRSHPELGRETRPRQWYFGLSRGRVGRRQVFHEHEKHEHRNITDIQTPNNAPSPKRFAKKKGRALINDLRSPTNAGWSSPVARQAHNLKVAGSNPAPATKYIKPLAPKRRGLFACGSRVGGRWTGDVFWRIGFHLRFRSFSKRSLAPTASGKL
jgi:hypothetical protein